LTLALNARLLALNANAFDVFLGDFPRSQILAWTGSGEPGIQRSVLNEMEAVFATKGMAARIGFDCDIVES
jgi:hypothetical protein